MFKVSSIYNVKGCSNKEQLIFKKWICFYCIRAFKIRKRFKDCISIFEELIEKDVQVIADKDGIDSNSSTLQMAITKYAKKRGLYKYSLHLFRHTFATLYLTNGGDSMILKKILGHRSFKMTEFYLHMAGKDLKRTIEYNPLNRMKIQNKQITVSK